LRSRVTDVHDPYQALRFRDFRLLLTGNLFVTVGNQMLGLAISWELYERTSSALNLGLVGLVQVIPVLTLSLLTGHVADRYNRKKIVFLSQLVLISAPLGLTALSYWHGSLVSIYGCLLVLGIGAAFNGPAARTLPVEVVPEKAFENAVTWTSSTQQLAAVAGPALGGLIIAVFGGTTLVYLLNALAASTFVVLLLFVRGGQATGHSGTRRRWSRRAG